MSNRYVGGVVTETTNVAQSPWSGSWTEQAAMQGFGSVLKITNSLRFRSSASAYLSRTPASAGNQRTFTFSTWLKRGALGNYIDFFGSGNTYLSYYNDNTLYMNLRGGATNYVVNYANVFRDPSAWYHIVWAVDTTQATASNRAKLYVNGVQLTAAGPLGQSYCPQNDLLNINSTSAHYLGAAAGSSNFLDGYMAEVNFIDGQALEPTAFGYINKETGIWAPIAYAGTYGLNGFRLPFTNGTSTTTLGYDTSGNGNNWTTNNISLTAGSTYDWMIDSPSKIQGTGYGVGNYAVLNPLYAYSSLTLSGANLNIASSANYRSGMASFGVSSGKWYWEYVVTAVGNDTILGISSNPSVTIASYPGNDALSWGYEAQVGNKYNNGSFSAYGATYTTNDVIGIAFDADAGSLTFYKNGVSQGVAYSGLASGIYYAAFGLGTSSTGSANFGQRPFAYTPPTGYKTLCTQNLPVATIYNGANFMAATTYTGTGATQTLSNAVNGVSFQPDMVWVKCRSVANNHVLYDSVRGAGSGKALSSSLTAQEGLGTTDADSKYGYVSSLNSNGFSVAGGSLGQQYVNTSAATYIGWQWKAGGTAVTNTAGTITSSVSANTTAGFSVVTYTGIATPGTVGHGLGANLGLLIVKCRNNASSWAVWHTALSGNQYLLLESTAAVGTASTVWNGATPTSSVFSVGSGSVPNTAGYTYVAYCFAAIAGYSAFGSYIGNGSSDGPFVYCGFRPRYLMIKRTDSTGAWEIYDTSRSPYNVTGAKDLQADSSAAEGASGISLGYDILSNGFKNRDTTTYLNASGATYIYAAFAENPFSVALAR